MGEKLNILFVHSSWPNQFSALHRYFRETRKAHSLCLISEQDRRYFQYDKALPDGIMSYVPDGELSQHSYYYSGNAEKNARHSHSILQACRKIVETHSIDIVVAHGILGAPTMLFDEIDAAIISYIEFPSFRHHQWDPQYPPQDAQRYCDKFEEMLNYYAALKSDAVIAPSVYAKDMFPANLRENIIVQMEGFDAEKMQVNVPAKAAFEKQPGCTYAGFSASTLSSEKGLEQFIVISKRLSQLNPGMRYVLLGASSGPSYCFENLFLEKHYPGMSFKDYLFAKHAVDESLYICTERLDAVAFSSTIHAMDFFLYPLQYGSANWGIYELLLRGKIVVAGNRCFLPEIIVSGENGFLMENEDMEGWARLCDQIARNPSAYKEIGRNAAQAGKKLYIENVAEEYLKIFSRVAGQRKSKL